MTDKRVDDAFALNEKEIAGKKMPASSSMGQSITFLKHILFGQDPQYIRSVLNNVARFLWLEDLLKYRKEELHNEKLNHRNRTHYSYVLINNSRVIGFIEGRKNKSLLPKINKSTKHLKNANMWYKF